MPRSCSRSFESIARSATRWFSRKEPDCLQQAINESRFAMIDVRDNRDIADIHWAKPFQARPGRSAPLPRL